MQSVFVIEDLDSVVSVVMFPLLSKVRIAQWYFQWKPTVVVPSQ